MSTQSSLRAIVQYKTNVSRATSRVSAEDSALDQLTNILTRAKELGVAQATDTATTQTRAAAGAELQQLFQQAISIANTKFGEEYLFGGDQPGTKPFDYSGTGATTSYSSTTPTGQRKIEVGAGQNIAVSHDGQQVFVTTGVLDSLRDLTRSMDPAYPTYGRDGIAKATSDLDVAFTNVQTLVGEVGARADQLETTGQNLDAFKANVSALKSDLQDVDLETAITELSSRQNAYQAAMLATSKVLGPTLTDYLR